MQISGRLSSFTVGIAGAGGLGSNCAVALARSGVGRLVVADFDRVTASNLNRQAFFIDQVGRKKAFALKENLLRINPEVKVTALDIRLTPDNLVSTFSECHVLVEAVDLAETKRMIVETMLAHRPDLFVVAGSGLAGYGDNDSLKTRWSGKLVVCGDERKEVSEALPPLAPRVGIVAHMQANVVLEILLAKGSNSGMSQRNQ